MSNDKIIATYRVQAPARNDMTSTLTHFMDQVDVKALSHRGLSKEIMFHQAAEQVIKSVTDFNNPLILEAMLKHLAQRWKIRQSVLKAYVNSCKEQSRMLNQIQLFIDTKCTIDPEHEECVQRIVDAYSVYASKNRFKQLSTDVLLENIGILVPISISTSIVYRDGKSDLAIRGMSLFTRYPRFEYTIPGADF